MALKSVCVSSLLGGPLSFDLGGAGACRIGVDEIALLIVVAGAVEPCLQLSLTHGGLNRHLDPAGLVVVDTAARQMLRDAAMMFQDD